jgi:hypothetical protein
VARLVFGINGINGWDLLTSVQCADVAANTDGKSRSKHPRVGARYAPKSLRPTVDTIKRPSAYSGWREKGIKTDLRVLREINLAQVMNRLGYAIDPAKKRHDGVFNSA